MRAIFHVQLPRNRLFSTIKSSVSRNSRSELNYKEENGISSPYDVIDRNPSGIQKRLQLLEMRRLNEQLILDSPEFEALKEQNKKSAGNSLPLSKENVAFTIEHTTFSNSPGLSHASNTSSSNSTVDLYIPPNTFNASDLDSIDQLLPFDENYDCYKLSVSDFPFISQNRKRAIELFESLKVSVPNPETFNISKSSGNEKNKTVKERREKKKSLDFPIEWLQYKKTENQ